MQINWLCNPPFPTCSWPLDIHRSYAHHARNRFEPYCSSEVASQRLSEVCSSCFFPCSCSHHSWKTLSHDLEVNTVLDETDLLKYQDIQMISVSKATRREELNASVDQIDKLLARQTGALGGFGRTTDVFQSCKMRSNPTFKLSWHTGSGRLLHYGPGLEALSSNVTT